MPPPSVSKAIVERKSYRPFSKENRSDTLLSLGLGLLSRPDSFAAGIGAGAEAIGQRRNAFDQLQRPTPAEIGGPDDSFEIYTDPDTGERTYKPIAAVQDYVTAKSKAKAAPKASDVVRLRSATASAISALPEAQRAQAYTDFREDSIRLGVDLGLPETYDPAVVAAYAQQGVTPVARLQDARAAAGRAQSQLNADRSYGLRVNADKRAALRAAAPPSVRKGRSGAGGRTRAVQQPLPSGAVLVN